MKWQAAAIDCRVQGRGGPGLDGSSGHGSSGSGRLRAEGTANQGSGHERAQATAGLRAADRTSATLTVGAQGMDT